MDTMHKNCSTYIIKDKSFVFSSIVNIIDNQGIMRKVDMHTMNKTQRKTALYLYM